MKVRYVRYLNSKRYSNKWMIEIKRKNKRYEPLYDGDKPYYFDTKDEAKEYWKSIGWRFE